MKMMKNKIGRLLTVVLIATIIIISTFVTKLSADEADGTVYDYSILSVTQTGSNEITVKLQARYCPYCNPNYVSNSGCPEFIHGYPPPYYPYQYHWCSVIDGRYIAVRIKNETGAILGTQKLVCNPINWLLDSIVTTDFIFNGILTTSGDIITAEADVYCSWCGHWYPEPKSLEIAPVKICIDPGHGGTAPGTLGWDDMVINNENCQHCGNKCNWKYGDSSFPNEKDINLDIALKLKSILEENNIEVIMTRTTDVYKTLQDRCDIANSNNCDLFVSIHCNAQSCSCCEICQNPHHTAHGTETYYRPSFTDSMDLAKHVQNEIIKLTGLHNRGTKGTAFYVLQNTNMPAALTEVVFLTNQNDFEYITTHIENAAQGISIGIIKYMEEKGLTINAKCPVDIFITDPSGLTISKQFNEIPGATYTEIDIDGDGELDDQIRIPDRKIGNYIIEVIPEPGASPTDTYTLEVILFGIPIIVAENIPISNIPSEPYIIESTETGVTLPTIQSIIDIDPDTLNLNSSGKWITCYIELPDGYDVADINISTILLNTVPAENKPTNISDYDNDGISDLMVKFDRQEVQVILEPGENVAITVTGKLFDETWFEGIDYIRVI